MDNLIREMMGGKRVLLLGFGREGQTSYQAIRKALPKQHLTIADINSKVREHELLSGDDSLSFRLGPDYLDDAGSFDIVVKSPGITLKDLSPAPDPSKITSQTDLFLRRYARQVIGVTGTKGKSTTSSLIFHILSTAGRDAVLLGNIGTPAFHFTERIRPETAIVYELSSHQLEYLVRSPHIAILLNLYQEHLDAYKSFGHYQLAKLNIAKGQENGDFLVYNADDPLVVSRVQELPKGRELVPFSLDAADSGYDFHNRYLRGDHNRRNVMAAVAACRIAGLGDFDIREGIDSFKGLAHRMEFVGRFGGIDFYNDSIATIPEACMAAVQAIPGVDTLLLGGFDRGIEYFPLARFLAGSEVRNFIVTGMAGERIAVALEAIGLQGRRLIRIRRFGDFLPHALKYTRPGHVCLLSPAAASYDEFRSFEERGMRFTELVKSVDDASK